METGLSPNGNERLRTVMVDIGGKKKGIPVVERGKSRFSVWKKKLEALDIRQRDASQEDLNKFSHPLSESIRLDEFYNVLQNTPFTEHSTGVFDYLEKLIDDNIDDTQIYSAIRDALLRAINKKDTPELRENLLRLFRKNIDGFVMMSGDYSGTNLSQVKSERRYDEQSEFLFSGGEDLDDLNLTGIVTSIQDAGTFKMKEAIPLIFEAFNKCPRAQLVYTVADALSKIDAQAGSAELLHRVRSKEYGRYDQEAYSRVLFLMELGRINIDEGVVQYFDLQYKLQGEKSEQAQTALRITGDGKIGLLDEGGTLIGYFELGNLGDEELQRKAQVLDIVRELVFANPDTPDDIRQQFLRDYSNFYSNAVSLEKQGLGIRISDLNLREQIWLYQFLNNATAEEKEKIRNFVIKFGREGVAAFVAVEEDRGMGDKILELGEILSERDMKKLLSNYDLLVEKAVQRSTNLASEFGDENSGLKERIKEGLLVRAKDILSEAYERVVGKEKEEYTDEVRKIVEDLYRESDREMVVSGMVRKTADLLRVGEPKSVALKNYIKDQEIILNNLAAAGGKGLFLRVLQSRGKLAPVPEIFWKVDRDNEDYRERFGFDVIELLRKLKGKGEKKILLEFGPGSGKSREERHEAGLDEHYTDVAVADSLYYHLRDLIKEIIDWGKLEEDLGRKISEEDKIFLAEVMYKTIVIKDGETGKENFKYDKERIKKMARDPNAVRDVILSVAGKLESVIAVPTDYSEIDDNKKRIYPRKILLSAMSEDFNRARDLFSKNSAKYIRGEQEIPDVYDALPAFPAGLIIGDFAKIEALKDDQIDVALGVRSTVYKEGEDYHDFMLMMFDKLKTGGVYVDDNIRENFGVNYRVEELKKIKEMWDSKPGEKAEINVYVIMGRGVKGEDDDKGEVPAAVVVCKGADHARLVDDLLDQEHYMLPLDQVRGFKTTDEELLVA